MGPLLPLVRKILTVGLEIMESSDKSNAACISIRFLVSTTSEKKVLLGNEDVDVGLLGSGIVPHLWVQK